MEVDVEQLYQRHYMQVYSFIMSLSKDQGISEEITQKTFLKLLTTKQKYKGDSSELTWICAIAKNLYFDECKKQNRVADLDDNAACKTNIEQSFENEDTAFCIHKILHSLEEPYKEVFQLRVFGELSFLNIGKIFQKTENWARVTYHRARLKIQERMNQL